MPDEAGEQVASLVQVDGVGEQTPQNCCCSGLRHTSGRPQVESSTQHCGCGHPSRGHSKAGARSDRHCAYLGVQEHWKQKSGVHCELARQAARDLPAHGSCVPPSAEPPALPPALPPVLPPLLPPPAEPPACPPASPPPAPPSKDGSMGPARPHAMRSPSVTAVVSRTCSPRSRAPGLRRPAPLLPRLPGRDTPRAEVLRLSRQNRDSWGAWRSGRRKVTGRVHSSASPWFMPRRRVVTSKTCAMASA